MLMPCEVAVKSVVPSIRAYVAIELTQTYNMRQVDVAALLGITQTAVSKYTTQVRGAVLKIDQTQEIQTMLKEIASQLANQEMKLAQKDLVPQFCEVCKIVRKEGIMCALCKRSDPRLNTKTCKVCKSDNTGCVKK
jgi:predicted transcriptional regulator